MKFIHQFESYQRYIKLDIPIDIGKAEVVGYFPYSTASIQNDSPKIPRKVMSAIEIILSESGIMDNKVVMICRDTERFGTDDFAIQFHDCGVRIGKLEHVVGYGGEELK